MVEVEIGQQEKAKILLVRNPRQLMEAEMPDNRITLVQAVRELRAQMIEAAREGADQEIQFMPETVEVELGITFDVQAEVGGGLKLLSLIDLSGKTKIGDQSTHKVKILLKPVDRQGNPTPIGSSILEK